MTYKVTFKSNQQSFIIQPEETILEAGLKNGHSLPYGCRNGDCGACKGKIISGDIYSEPGLTGITQTETDKNYALFCHSKAKSDLIIDVKLVSQNETIHTRKLPCRVIQLDKLNHDVMRLKLKLPKTERLRFLAGQYIDILMSDGQKRSFSLANAPHNDDYLELHIRYYKDGAFSEYAFNKLQEKTLLRIEGPLGSFFFREDSDRPIIMVAGGTGFAPIKSIIEHILTKNKRRSIYLYWGTRARNDLYMNELAENWQTKYEFIYYVPVLSEPKQDDQWQGRTGLVHEAVLEDFNNLADFDVYTCGPPPMTKAVCQSLSAQGLNIENIYSDSFEFPARKA